MADSSNAGNNPPAQRGSTDDTIPERRRRGLTPRGERIASTASVAVLAALAITWTWSIAIAAQRGPERPPPPTRAVTASLTDPAVPTAAYITDAALNALVARARGASGKLRVQTVLPKEVNEALKNFTDFAQITLTPLAEKQRGKVGLYYIGTWPSERGARGPGKAPAGRYDTPRGFIPVTPESQNTRVSEHFRLRDFLTHDQPNVWPKYLVLEMRNVDKLELVLADLARRGVNTAGVTVMSGFRTPQYNVGGGQTGGRAGLSRHMYGDAADIFIDNDHNGVMDDLNRDGRVDIGDARLILESVERVEREHPELIGGAGTYIACCGHGPFIHIDSRGYRARWTGAGGG